MLSITVFIHINIRRKMIEVSQALRTMDLDRKLICLQSLLSNWHILCTNKCISI